MSITTDIKHWFGNWKLKRSDLEKKRIRKVYNLKSAKRITVLFDGTEEKDVRTVKAFVSELSKGKDEVTALGYVNEKGKSIQHMSILHFDFFSQEELNWYGKPQGMVIENFIKEDYDILIDLSLKEFYPLTYLAVASPSKFKVGRYREDVKVFDLMIDNKKKPGLEALITEISYYLNRIDPS